MKLTLRLDLIDDPDLDRHAADALNTTWWVWKRLLGHEGITILDAETDLDTGDLGDTAQQRWDEAPEWRDVADEGMTK